MKLKDFRPFQDLLQWETLNAELHFQSGASVVSGPRTDDRFLQCTLLTSLKKILV